MEQREKLIELIIESVHGLARNWAEVIADHLLANGVVVLPCRCGECKHFYKYNCHSDNMRMNMCKLAVGTDGEDFFCSYAERKRR